MAYVYMDFSPGISSRRTIDRSNGVMLIPWRYNNSKLSEKMNAYLTKDKCSVMS